MGFGFTPCARVFRKVLSTVKANCVVIRRICPLSGHPADGGEDDISELCPPFVTEQKKAVNQNSFDLKQHG